MARNRILVDLPDTGASSDEGGDDGGIFGIFKEVPQLIKSAPGGLAHFVENAFVDPVGGAVLGAGLGAPFGGVGALPGAAIGGLVGGTGDLIRHAVDPSAPWSETVAGFKHTAENLIHPTHYANAYEHGHLLSELVGDIGNISIVGGAASKAFGAATGTTAAATAAREAVQAEATAAAARDAATLADETYRSTIPEGGTPDPVKMGEINNLKVAADEAAVRAGELRTKADTIASETAGAQRIQDRFDTILHGAERGAFAPFVPWSAARRLLIGGEGFKLLGETRPVAAMSAVAEEGGVLGKAAEKVAGMTPGDVETRRGQAKNLAQAGAQQLIERGVLGPESISVRAARREQANTVDQLRDRLRHSKEEVSKLGQDTVERLQQIFPDEIDQTAANFARVAEPSESGVLSTLAILKGRQAPEVIDAVLDHLAETTSPTKELVPHYRAALDRLIEIFDPARATDEDVIAYRTKLAEYDRVMREGIFGARENAWYAGLGDTSDRPQSYREWQRTGTTPYEPALKKIVAERMRNVDRLLKERAKLEARAARLLDRRPLPEGVTYDEVARQARDAAYGVAHQMLHSAEIEYSPGAGTVSEVLARAYEESLLPRRLELASSSDKILSRIGKEAAKAKGHDLSLKLTQDLATRIMQIWRNGTEDAIGQQLVQQFVDRAGTIPIIPTEVVTGGTHAARAYKAAMAAGRSEAEARVASDAALHAQRQNERLATMIDAGMSPAEARRKLDRLEKVTRSWDRARSRTATAKTAALEEKTVKPTAIRKWVMEQRRMFRRAIIEAAKDEFRIDPRLDGEQPQRPPTRIWSDMRGGWVDNRTSDQYIAFENVMAKYGLEPSDFKPPRYAGDIWYSGRKRLGSWPRYVEALDTWAQSYGQQELLKSGDNTWSGTAEQSPIDVSLEHWAQRVAQYKQLTEAAKDTFNEGILPERWAQDATVNSVGSMMTGNAYPAEELWYLSGHIDDVVERIVSGNITDTERFALPETLLSYGPVSERIGHVSDVLNADYLAASEAGWSATEKPAGRESLSPEDQRLYDFAAAKLSEEGYGRLRSASRETIIRAVSDGAKNARAYGRIEGEISGAERIARTEGRRADADRIKSGDLMDQNGQMLNDVVAASTNVGYKLGKIDKEIMQVRQRIGWNQRALESVDVSLQKALDEAAADVKNAPAAYKDTIRINRVVNEALLEQAKILEAAGLDGAAAEMRMQAGAMALTLAEVVKANPDWRPVHVVGGVKAEAPDVRVGTRESASGALPTKRAVRSYRERVGLHTETTAEALAARSVQDFHAMLHNQFADLAGTTIGTRITDHLELAGMLRDWKEAKNEGGPSDISRMEDAARRMSEWMLGEGWLPWDANSMSRHGIMSIEQVAKNPEAVVWLPERAIRRFHRDSMVSPLGPNLEAFARKWYDTPVRIWKNAVLALRPAWQVGNIFGNAVMATVGGGIDPVTYLRRIRQAWAVLRETSPQTLVERYGISDAQMMGLVEGRVPSELFRRGSMIADREMLGKTTGTMLPSFREMVRHPIEWSYEANGLFDDLNRLTIFLEKLDRGYTEKEVAYYRTKYPDLAAKIDASKVSPEFAGMEFGGDRGNPWRGVYRDMAIREALNIAGDFTKLTPVERYIVRRIMPFWPFMKHMTKLTWELSTRHPLRIAWMMNMGRLSNSSDAPLLWGAIQLPGGNWLRLPQINPFANVVDMFDISPTTGEPSAMGVLGAVSPIITDVAVGLGAPEPRSGGFLNLPPTATTYDAYGRPAAHPLFLHPLEFANYVVRQIPQATDLIEGMPDLLFGHRPMLRYSTGDVMRSGGESIPANAYGWNPFGPSELPVRLQFLGPIASQFGIPTIQNIDVQGIIDRANARRSRNAASERRYLTGSSTG